MCFGIKHTIGKIRKTVGVVFQDPDDQLFMPTVIEDVMFGPKNFGYSNEESETNAVEALKMVGMENFQDRAPHHLSFGQKRKVAIATVLASKPKLLVLDEPVQGVDFTGEIALYKLIKKISDELNCGILLISHDIHTVMSATDHVVCLNGHVCCSGSPMDVAKNNEYKALFGEQASQILSRYEHRHDHIHTNEGEIKKN